MATHLHERHRQVYDDILGSERLDTWVGGQAYEATTGERFEVIDPSTGDALATLPACDGRDVDTAVDCAWTAFENDWSDTTPAERSQRLSDWVDEVREHAAELATLECLETGKPIEQARGEVDGAIDTLAFYADVPRTLDGRQIPAREDVHVYTRTEPYGVVGQITPWNFPIWAAAWKLGPALATGNAAVLKPSVHGSLTTVRLAQLSANVLPDGLINVVTGHGSDVGGPLSDHQGVRKLSFTGSGDVGQRVMQSAAETITPVTLELGGKSPFLVFPDADLDTAVDAVATGIFYSSGEICDAFSRALVHEDIVEEFTARFVEATEAYRPGDPLNEATSVGPLTTRDQFTTVLEYVEVGQSEGATLATGGGCPDEELLADGWYVEPTVFTDVESDMRIAKEEIFGPVQTIQTFSTYEEAIRLANDTEYGLAAGVGTERTTVAHRAAADLEAGLVYVNDYGPVVPEAPFGGFKRSGIGRDIGTEVLDHYRQPKTVYVNLDEPDV